MKRIPIRALVIAAACIAATPAGAQTVLTASSFLPNQHFQTISAIVQLGADIEKATEGRVKVNLLPKAVVAPPGTFDAVRDGLVDIAWTVHGLTSARFVLTNIAELPGNGDSAEATSVAYQRIHERYLAKAGEHKGVKVLAVFTHGPGAIQTTKKQVNTITWLD
jgi:TRAP-type C4-dicarboxylate transport system substrate-binding protein